MIEAVGSNTGGNAGDAHTTSIREGHSYLMMGRLRLRDRSLPTAETHIKAIQLWVYDEGESLDEPTDKIPLSVPSSFTDALRKGGEWRYDSEGYNLAFALPPAALPGGGSTVRLEFLVTVLDDTAGVNVGVETQSMIHRVSIDSLGAV